MAAFLGLWGAERAGPDSLIGFGDWRQSAFRPFRTRQVQAKGRFASSRYVSIRASNSSLSASS